MRGRTMHSASPNPAPTMTHLAFREPVHRIFLVLVLTIPLPIAGQSLEVGEITFSFGVLDGPDEEVLGKIEDIALGPRGDIFLTDSQQMRVGWLRPDGSLAGWFGREGDGPEEFRWLKSVEQLQDGRVVVADQGHRRLVFFTLADAGLAFDTVVRIPMIPRDLCTMGDRLFVLSFHEGRVVHEIDSEGAVVQSFGTPLETPFEVGPLWDLRVSSFSGDGEILCLPKQHLIIVLPLILPEIRAFRTDGSPAWVHVLEPYSRTVPTETDRGTMRMDLDPKTGKTHNSVSLWRVNDEMIAAQLIEYGLGTFDESRAEVRFLDIDSGRIVARQNNVPRVAGLLSDGLVYWEDSPVPRVIQAAGGVR